MKKPLRLRAVAAASMLVLASSPASALDFTWLGGTGLWSDTNWSDGVNGPIAYPAGNWNTVIGAAGTADATVTLRNAVDVASLVIGRAQDRLILEQQLGGSTRIVNNGHIDIIGSGSLVLAGLGTTLSGSGTTTMQNRGIAGDSLGRVWGWQLTIDTGHTFEAGGLLGDLRGSTQYGWLRGLENRGTIIVTPRPGLSPRGLTIEVSQGGFTNRGLMVAPDETFLSIESADTTNVLPQFNAAGRIELGPNSLLRLKGNNLLLQGAVSGPVGGTAYARAVTDSQTILDTTLNGNVMIGVGGGSADSVYLSGMITNNGNLHFETPAATGTVYIGGSSGFKGGGDSYLNDRPTTILPGGGGAQSFEIGSGHTLHIDGSIGNWDPNPNVIAPFPLVNNRGTIWVDEGQALSVWATRFDNTGGTVTLGKDVTLTLRDRPNSFLPAAQFVGGTLVAPTLDPANMTVQHATLAVDRVTLRDVRLNGNFELLAGGTVGPALGNPRGWGGIGGVITVNDSLRVVGPGPLLDTENNPRTLTVALGGATLAGPGTTVMADVPRNVVNGDVLTIAGGHVLRGGGTFGSLTDGTLAGFVNQGTVIVDAPVNGMHFEGGDSGGQPLRNFGLLQVNAGSTLTLSSTSYLQDDAAAHLVVDGDMTVQFAGANALPSMVVSQGGLDGCGTIHVQSLTIGSAVVQPAATCLSFAARAGQARTRGNQITTPGTLHIDGDLRMGLNSHLTLDLGAPGRSHAMPALDISGDAGFGGILEVRLGDPDTVVIGDTFQLFSFGSFSGNFSEVLVQGYDVNTFFNGNVLSVLVTSAVPEPAPWALLLAGASAWLLRRRRAMAN